MTRILALQQLKVNFRGFKIAGSWDSSGNGTQLPGTTCCCPHNN